MGFESFEQMGEAQDAMTEEFAEFNAKQPIRADLVNQVVLRNSTIISYSHCSGLQAHPPSGSNFIMGIIKMNAIPNILNVIFKIDKLFIFLLI